MFAMTQNGTFSGLCVCVLLATLACNETSERPSGERAKEESAGVSERDGGEPSPAADEVPVGAMNTAGAGASTSPVVGGNAAPGVPSFQLLTRIEGDRIVIDVSGPQEPIFVQGCGAPAAVYRVEDRWVPVRDDRPPSQGNAAYYVDDTYVPATEACDAPRCVPVPDGTQIEVSGTYEYIKSTETRTAPPDADNVLWEVPLIERFPLSGSVSVAFTYFRDDACLLSERLETYLDIPVPSRGVCCPIGLAECSSEGPGGGWAPTLEQCAPFASESDVLFEQRTDPRGCPLLVPNRERACGANGDRT